MAASTTPNPTTTTTIPIPGGSITFKTPQPNTTGYPKPPDPPGTLQMMMSLGPLPSQGAPRTQEFYVALPSTPALEFSIADLRFLGNVTDIRDLVFEMTFINPETAQVEEFQLEIASPEREHLYLANLVSEGCIHHRSHTIHTFSLNAEDACKAEDLFVPGNRFIVHARVSEVKEGKLQAAVRKSC